MGKQLEIPQEKEEAKRNRNYELNPNEVAIEIKNLGNTKELNTKFNVQATETQNLNANIMNDKLEQMST